MPGDPPLAGPIRSVTVTVRDLSASLHGYEAGLGFRTAHRDRLDSKTAETWGAPGLTGADIALLQPADAADDAPGALRLVQPPHGTPSMPPPLATYGWAAAELSVIDPEARLQTATAAGFVRLGDLRPQESPAATRTVRIVGPDGEVLFLTDTRADDGPLDLYAARSPVDRCFIAALATPGLAKDRGSLERSGLGRRVTDRPVAVAVLNACLGLPEDHLTRISSLQLAGGCAIEIDGYPRDLADRPHTMGWPTGIALVSIVDPKMPPGARPEILTLPGGARLERVAAA